jgi:hypothetical protein
VTLMVADFQLPESSPSVGFEAFLLGVASARVVMCLAVHQLSPTTQGSVLLAARNYAAICEQRRGRQDLMSEKKAN